MSKVYFQDLRGWDNSDPFGLTIIGALDTLEREGALRHNMANRKRIGEINLALSTHLDYYSFLIVPSINRARKTLLEDANSNQTGICSFDNKHLGMTYYLESSFKELITIDELIKQMVYEVMSYLGIQNEYLAIDEDKRYKKQMKDVQKLILEVLDNKRVKSKQWFGYINSLRNFVTHEGALTIHYVEERNIHFYKKHWNRRYKITMNTVIRNLNKFMKIRQALRDGLSDVNYWRSKLSST